MTFFNEIRLHQARIKAWQMANVRRYFYEKGCCLDYITPNDTLAAAYTATLLPYWQVTGYISLN